MIHKAKVNEPRTVPPTNQQARLRLATSTKLLSFLPPFPTFPLFHSLINILLSPSHINHSLPPLFHHQVLTTTSKNKSRPLTLTMTAAMEALKHKASVAPIPTVRRSFSSNMTTTRSHCSHSLGLELTPSKVVPGNTPIYQKAGDVGNRTLWYAFPS